MMNYLAAINRLAERYITKHLEAGKDTIVEMYDVLDSYTNFAGMTPVIPNDELFDKIKARFPDIEFDYIKGIIIGLNWIRPKKAEPPKPVDFKKQQLDLRLETMIRLNPKYESGECGFEAKTFAHFVKQSITAGGILLELNEIPLTTATEYLDSNPKCKKI